MDTCMMHCPLVALSRVMAEMQRAFACEERGHGVGMS
jgi:hypothetical protein